MTERDFCYWLQGFFEVGKPTTLNEVQTELIRKHLDLLFEHKVTTHIIPQFSIIEPKVNKDPKTGMSLLCGSIDMGGSTPLNDLVWMSSKGSC